MAKSARVAAGESAVDDVAKASAEEGEVKGRNSGPKAMKTDKVLDAASADSGLSVDEKAVKRDAVGTEPVNVSMIDEDAVGVKPENGPVLAEGIGVDC